MISITEQVYNEQFSSGKMLRIHTKAACMLTSKYCHLPRKSATPSTTVLLTNTPRATRVNLLAAFLLAGMELPAASPSIRMDVHSGLNEGLRFFPPIAALSLVGYRDVSSMTAPVEGLLFIISKIAVRTHFQVFHSSQSSAWGTT